MTTERIHSIEKIWSAVDRAKTELDKRARALDLPEQANEPVWYRGHSRSVYTLRPSLFRTANGPESEYRLHQVYRAFKPLLTGWETLFHMQHFFVPTRLLDWTTDLSSALFFALNDEDYDVPSLFVLHPCMLNWYAFNGDVYRLLPFFPGESARGSYGCPFQYPQDYVSQELSRPRHRLPITLRPGLKNGRIRSQSGMFTIHGAALGPIEELCSDCVVKIEIDVPSVEMRLLRDLGRESRDVFPDETGMSRTLRNRFGLRTIRQSEAVIKEALFQIWQDDDKNLKEGHLGELHMQGIADCALGSDYFDRASTAVMQQWLAEPKQTLALVLGPAARGKTNLIVNFTLEGKRYASRLFLFCRLSDFTPREQTLGEFLAAALAQMAKRKDRPDVPIDELTLESMISEGAIVLILDGLDELVRIQGVESAAHLGADIRRLTSRGSGRAKIIVGCRDNILGSLESKAGGLVKNARRIKVEPIPVDELMDRLHLQKTVAELVAGVPLLCRVLHLAPDPSGITKESQLWDLWLDDAGRRLSEPLERPELLTKLGAVATLMLKRRSDSLSEKQLKDRPDLLDLVRRLSDRTGTRCPLLVEGGDHKWRFAHQAIREYVLASNIKYGLSHPDSDNVLVATSALDYESAETYLRLQDLLLDLGSKHISTNALPSRTSMGDDVKWNNFARNYFEAVGMLGVKDETERAAAINQALDAIAAEKEVRLKTKFNAARCLARLHPTSPPVYCEHASKSAWPEIDSGDCVVVYGYAVRDFHQTTLTLGCTPPEVFLEFKKEVDFLYDSWSEKVSRQLLDQIERLTKEPDLREGERFLQVNCAHALIRWLHAPDEQIRSWTQRLMTDPNAARETRMNLFLALCVHRQRPENAAEILMPQKYPNRYRGDLDKLGPEDDSL